MILNTYPDRPCGLPAFVVALSLLLLLAGCLPSSCRRTESQALFPSDSASRRLAARTPTDTLRPLWQTDGPEAHPLKHPRTVQRGPDGQIYVGDLECSSIFVFDTSGAFQREIQPDAFAYPYVAGWRGDTLVAYAAQARRFDFVVNDQIARSVPVPGRRDLSEDALTYPAATDSALYVKVVGEDAQNRVVRLGAGGSVRERWRLPGPRWRRAGLVRSWGDSLLSLSGYRPVIDVLHSGERGDAAVDTVRLRGFDSPMLARSRAFVQGDADEPPLLSASADPAGEGLFVLNMRPARLRVDVYDRRGRLQHVLVGRKQARSVFPMDLAVWRAPGGGYALATVAARPEPRLTFYRWHRLPL
jgi:hypothetical protein